MYKITAIVILLFGTCLYTAKAQNESCINNSTNTWFFGNHAGITFNTDPPTVLTGSSMDMIEGCSSISDKVSGRILFYTDGINVWDSTHNVMPNGSGLQGIFDAEENEIVPFPGHPSQYYLFTTSHSKGTYYSVVDMDLNDGKGDIISGQKNINLLAAWTAASDKVTCTKHGNGQDYWVIVKEVLTDGFYVYLLNAAGLQNPTVVHIGQADFSNEQWAGVLKFNRQGNLLINCQPSDAYTATSRLQCFNFNNLTGQISSEKFTISNIWFPYGVEFSPDNSLLYVAHEHVFFLDQYDITSSDIQNSNVTIAYMDSARFGQLQLGPDNKIYVAEFPDYYNSYGFLGVINQPNNLGSGCNFNQHGINLYPNGSRAGLPSGVCEVTPEICYGPELITNGDFEHGYTFFSDLATYSQCGSCDSGYYILQTKGWCNQPNHTPYGEYMMSVVPDSVNRNIWFDTIHIAPHTTYQFTFWAYNYNSNPPIFTVIINSDTIVFHAALQSDSTGWQYVSGYWFSDSDSVAIINLTDIQTDTSGNIFALDDISMKAIVNCKDSQCAYVDTFNCSTLTFQLDSSRFCVPIILPSDSVIFKNHGFQFCMSYDTNFVKPTGIYTKPFNNYDFNIGVDSIIKGKICVSISHVHHITYNSRGEIELGCLEFVLNDQHFSSNPINYFDYLSFNILDGCNTNLYTINAWLTEDLEYWATEDNKYWKLDH